MQEMGSHESEDWHDIMENSILSMSCVCRERRICMNNVRKGEERKGGRERLTGNMVAAVLSNRRA